MELMLVVIACFFVGIIYILKAGATAIKEDDAIVDAGIKDFEAAQAKK